MHIFPSCLEIEAEAVLLCLKCQLQTTHRQQASFHNCLEAVRFVSSQLELQNLDAENNTLLASDAQFTEHQRHERAVDVECITDSAQ